MSTAVHARAEAPHAGKPFDTVVARAFAALPELLEKVAPLCGPQTRVLAMKGKRPDDEIAGVPARWRVIETRALTVPGLECGAASGDPSASLQDADGARLRAGT